MHQDLPLGTKSRRSLYWPTSLGLRLLLTLMFIAIGHLSSAGSTMVSAPTSSSKIFDSDQLEQLQEASKLHAQAQLLFKQGHYVEALPLAKQALALRERILDSKHADIASSLTTLGLIHATLIQLPQAKALLQRALGIHQSATEHQDFKVGESLTNLATVVYASGDFVKAIHTLEHSLAIREKTLGLSHPDVAVTLTHLAIAQRGLSRLEQALTTIERAITILRTASSPRPNDLAIAVNVQGNILARLGNFEAARLALEESLHLFEHVSGPHHPDFAGGLAQLAMLERKQGNVVAALPLLKQALAITEDRYGSTNPEVAGILYEIGLVELVLNKVKDAKRRFERAIAIQESTVGPTHPFIALSFIELAEVKRRQGDRSAAGELLQHALQIQEDSLGREHTSVAQTLTRLGYLEAQSHDLLSAKSHFTRAVQIRKQALGTSHRDSAASLFDLARIEHALGQLHKARQLYERARLIIQSQHGLNPGLTDEALSQMWKMDRKGLQDYALLLATLTQDSHESSERQSAIADGFMVTQQARGWLMQAAVANALAQQVVGSSEERSLVKQVKRLRRTRQELWTRINGLYALSEGQRSSEELAALKDRLAEAQKILTQVNSQLTVEAPRYAELSQPDALDLKSAQSLLRANEALVSFSTLGDRLQIWLLRSGHPVLYRQVMIPQRRLSGLVQNIRSSIDGTTRQPANSDSGLAPYDVTSAAELFQLLFTPILSSLPEVEHLILVPDDLLLPLPFAALLTHSEGMAFSHLDDLYHRGQSPSWQDLAGYSRLPWLVQAYALTILPSTSALKLLRQNRVLSQGGGEPFLGFGDPILRGSGTQRGGKMVATRGMRVAMDSLHALNRLPGTREELLTVASILHVDPERAVYLGSRATENEVRRLNQNGRLGKAKVLAFSTHGLLAGEVQGVTQPALVLTPPAVPTEENDGLLSMEDILQLKLSNTDWVVLSACNTAGDDGSGESLSGLARAFFFAGAKALLVSQWSVDDEATKVLMSEVFKRYGGQPSMPPAKALREGMLAVVEKATLERKHSYFAHPYAWAAFSLVGEGIVEETL